MLQVRSREMLYLLTGLTSSSPSEIAQVGDAKKPFSWLELSKMDKTGKHLELLSKYCILVG